MSNLSDLLPAGAGAKSFSFTADGTLSSGQTVALQTDGTVKAVSSTGLDPGAGTAEVFYSGIIYENDIAYDPVNNVLCIVYRNGSVSQQGYFACGVIDGNGDISWTTGAFHTGTTYYPAVTYDANAGKFVVAYRDGSNSQYGTAQVGTYSAGTITWGSDYIFETAQSDHINIVYSEFDNKCVIAYKDVGNSGYPTAVVATVSGTSISFGTRTVVESNAVFSIHPIGLTYFAGEGTSGTRRIVLAYNYNPTPPTIRMGAAYISGTNIVFGSFVSVTGAGSAYRPSVDYDSTNNRVILAYQDFTGGYYKGAVLAATLSGSTITLGSASYFVSDSDAYYPDVSDHPAISGVVVNCKYAGAAVANSGVTFPITGTGTSVTIGSDIVFEAANTNYIRSTYVSNTQKIQIAYSDNGNSNYGTTNTVSGFSTNSVNFVGITDQAIADTATGSVVVEGGVTEKLSGLTTGSTYYVQNDGSLSTTSSSVTAGKALSATKLLLKG